MSRATLEERLGCLWRLVACAALACGAPSWARAIGMADIEIEDPSGQALGSFHQALLDLEAGKRTLPIRIVVFGDSNLAADRFTGAMRRFLQARFGDAGHGFVALGEPWPGYRHQNVRHGYTGGFKTTNPTTARGRDHRWGYGGIAADSVGSGTVWVATSEEGPVGTNVENVTVLYLAQPNGGDVEVFVDGRPYASFSTATPVARTARFTATLPDGPHEVRWRPRGAVRLYGAIMERNRPGVVLDSIGIGALSTYNLLLLDRACFVEQLASRHPDLIVLTIGTNDQNARRLVGQRRALIERLREAAPHASVLMLSPPDHARWSGNEWRSENRMLQIARALRPIAAETSAAFWDLYEAMGGLGSMPRWAAAGFAGGDRIHYRQPLADRMAAALLGALERDRERWRGGRAGRSRETVSAP